MSKQRAHKGPGADLGIYARTSEAELLEAMRRLRREAEAEIERLMAFLDRLDGDWDCENDADDPVVPYWGGKNETPLGQCEDDEPSLGWRGVGIGCRPGDGCAGRDEDLEHEHDGREPECEDEGGECNDEGFAEQDGNAPSEPDHEIRLRLRRGQPVGCLSHVEQLLARHRAREIDPREKVGNVPVITRDGEPDRWERDGDGNPFLVHGGNKYRIRQTVD